MNRCIVSTVMLLGLLVFMLPISSLAVNEGERHPHETEGTKKVYREGELLVKFKQSVSEKVMSDAHHRYGLRVLRQFRSLGIHRIKLNEGVSIEDAVEAYRADPAVEYAEPNYRMTVTTIPNDLYLNRLWALSNTGLDNTGQPYGTPGADIQALEAWDIVTGRQDVVVAVIDTGVDYNHPDISANMWVNAAEYYGAAGRDEDANGYVDDAHGINTSDYNSDPMDDHGHGTHVAGTIGALGNNGIGVVGVNWNVKIIACKFIGEDGNGYADGAIACLEYVRAMKERGVNVVATNNSWGGGGYSQALYDAINAQRDILFIAAAGNSYGDNDALPFYPAGYRLPNVISVAATDRWDRRADFSNRGRRTVYVGAPGVDIVSLRAPGTDMYHDGAHFEGGGENPEYYRSSGTSMAAPHVTGLAALIKSQDPSRNWIAVKNLILSGGEVVPSLSDGTITGRRINAYGALTCSDSPVFSALEYPAEIKPGVAVTVSALSINCESPVGPVTVTASADGLTHDTVTLRDDGVAPDLAAGDGIFTGTLTPSHEVQFLTFSSPAGTERVKVPLIIATSYLSAGIVGRPYSETVKTIGGVKPYAWSIDTGSLPDGLTLNSSTGEISGVATAGGRFSFTVKVSDADNAPSVVTRPLSIDTYMQPDLVVSALSGPASADPGQQVTVIVTVKNQGKEAAGTSRLALYLSADPAITTSDIHLGFIDVSILAKDEQQTRDIGVTIPANLNGSYYLGAIADVDNWIQESDETNNGRAGSRITIGRFPDLTITSVSGPASGIPGQQTTVTSTVSNQGQGSAGLFRIGIYLSADSSITTGDTLIGYVTVNSLAAAAQQTVNVTVTIPASAAAGTYYLGAIADDTGAVPESNESNNTIAGNQVSISQLPDLTISSVSGPVAGYGGQRITVIATVKNQGWGNTGTFRVGIYLSKDPVITGSDTFLGYISVTSLPAGGEQPITSSVTIPSGTAAGAYYLGAIADYTSTVAESDETNNGRTGNQISIGPDLVMTSASGPTNARVGQQVTVTYTVLNQGRRSAGSFRVGIFLSTDATVTTGDIYLGQAYLSSVGAGSQRTTNTRVTIPSSLSPGTYYIGVIADTDNRVAEADETNNARAGNQIVITR